MKNNYKVGDINNMGFNGMNHIKVGANMKTFDNSIEQALENLAKRIQREIPQNGSFGKIVERFDNPEKTTYAKDFSIEVVAGIGENLKDIRFVNVKTEHPHLDKVRGGAIFSGTTDEVLAFLKEPKKYTQLIRNIVTEDSEKLAWLIVL